MKTYLVTGGADFIGANFIKYMLNKYDTHNINLVVLDKLIYAGNLKTLENELDSIQFIGGDICNRDLVSDIFSKNEIDYIVNLYTRR